MSPLARLSLLCALSCGGALPRATPAPVPARAPAPAAVTRSVHIDADTGNEIDDLYAIFRALTAPEYRVVGLSSVFWTGAVGRGTAESQRLNEEILSLMGLRQRIPHPAGAAAPMPDRATPVDSAAARHIIAQAKAIPQGQKLRVFVLGAYTNVASALLLDPSIKDRLAVHLMGYHHRDGRLSVGRPGKEEFNCKGDLAAAAYMLESGVDLHVMPIEAARQLVFEKAAAADRLEGRGGIKDYLLARWESFRATARTWIMWDIAVIEADLLPALGASRTIVQDGRTIRVWTDIDEGAMQRDFWAAADPYTGPGVLAYPPRLPGGSPFVTDGSPEFLSAPVGLRAGVRIARTPPTVDFMFYPGQDRPGRPWSVWGRGEAVGDKYYSAIGDHRAPIGTARVFEYDAATRQMRALVDLRSFLESSGALTPGMGYTPAKVHTRITMGRDGWLYYATHRGSPDATTDRNGYLGDWIFRTHPGTSRTEIVGAHPVSKHSIPMGLLDPARLIFYGGTAAGRDAPRDGVHFFSYDVGQRRLLATAHPGPAREAILASSTGRLYYVPDGSEDMSGRLVRFDPARPSAPVAIDARLGLRAATRETPRGIVYAVSKGGAGRDATLWAFDTRTEKAEALGGVAVVREAYVASLDVDPTGRFLYYVPGAHGGAGKEGTPIVQFDLRTRTRKVIAFLSPFYPRRHGYTPDGTFSSVLDPSGEKLYVTWNGMRAGASDWESCALTVIHIPASERK